MSAPRPARARRLVAAGVALFLCGTAAATSLAGGSWAAPTAPKAPTLAVTCAAPALAPGLRARPWDRASDKARAAVRVAALGRASSPARAQALAATAALAGDLVPADARAFYASLRKLDGWASLPPTIAIHRVLGTPDPFAYEAHWDDAVTLLARASGTGSDDVAVAVSSGGSAPGKCRPSAADVRGLPLPAGSSYRVAFATEHGETSFLAACGTPVLAATAGKVTVSRDGARTGPWVIRVHDRSQGVTTSYAHVQLPRVRDGQTVVVGQQVGEVGDLGDVRRCELGLRADPDEGRAYDRAELLSWLSTQPRPEKKEKEKEPRVRTIPPTSFRFATFNVLGSHLTAGRGGPKARFAPGPTRMARGLARIEASGVSIVVFNEFESPAAAVVTNDGDWTLHRATPNNNFRGGNSAGNAVAWRTDTWKPVETGEFTVPWKIPLHMPVVTLENLQTGGRVTVVGVHNPASTSRQGNQAGNRAVARRVELTQIGAMRQSDPDLPVLFAGDMNERNEAFCGFTLGGMLRSSAGGSVGAPCRVPRHGPVDWIFGTTDVTFGGQVIDRSTLGSVSDHPLLSASVTIPEQQR